MAPLNRRSAFIYARRAPSHDGTGAPPFAALIGGHLHSASEPRRNAGRFADTEERMTVKDPKPGLTISDSHFDEQFPLAPIDDYMIHQTPDPVRVVWSTDPRIYERFWVICHDNKGELLLVTGASFYPNLDTAEAYAIVNFKGQHTSIRAFRRLGADRMNMHIGPIKPTIIQGMRLWRYMLEENDWGISYDLHWHDTKRQIYHAASGSVADGSPRGRRADVTAGFEGFGVAEKLASLLKGNVVLLVVLPGFVSVPGEHIIVYTLIHGRCQLTASLERTTKGHAAFE